jgi:hypothetical protein
MVTLFLYENNSSIRYEETLLGDIAHLFTIGNEDQKYVIKFHNYRNRTKKVINEYIVGKLGERLSLPVLPAELLYVPDQDIAYLPDKIRKRGAKAGFHVSFPYIDSSISFHEFPQLPGREELTNPEALAGMIVFDLWINNTDRSSTNLLFQPFPSGFRFLMIDHGRCFPGRYNWTVESLHQGIHPRINMPVYKWATRLLNQEEDLRLFVERIQALEESFLYEIVHSVPKDWMNTAEEKESLIQFLTKQQHGMDAMVQNYIETYRHLIKR